MRRVGCSAIAVGVALGSMSGHVAGNRSSCATARGTTLAATSTARVYSVPATTDWGDPKTYGCRFGVKGRISLDDPGYAAGAVVVSRDTTRGKVRFAGDKVAVSLLVSHTEDYVDCDYEAVEVYDLRTGKRIVSADDGSSCPNERTVMRLLLRPSGSVAWSSVYGISRVSVGPTGHAVTDPGDAVIDDSRKVRPHSLHLRRSQLSWLHGSSRRTTTLP